MSKAGDKRNAGDQDDGSNESARKHQKTTALKPLSAHQLPADISILEPQDVHKHIDGLSKDRHCKLIMALFTEQPEDPQLATMHKQWFEARRPSLQELWDGRAAKWGMQKGKVLKAVFTLRELLVKIPRSEKLKLHNYVSQMLLDYIMFLRLDAERKKYRDEVFGYFADHEQQFESIADDLKEAFQEKAIIGKEVGSDRNVSPERHLKMENLVVERDSVEHADQLFGCEDAKEILAASIKLPIKSPHLAKFAGRGILLHGPPGTGKTHLALSVASMVEGCKVYRASSDDIIEKWQGASERNVKALFAVAHENSPSAIIVDEADGLFRTRSEGAQGDEARQSVKTVFLSMMSMYKQVIVVGITNLPWVLDSAFWRRFQETIHMGLPNAIDREGILKLKLKDIPNELNDSDILQLAKAYDGLTGDAIDQAVTKLVRTDLRKAIKAEYFREVTVDGHKFMCACRPGQQGAKRTSYDAVADRLQPAPLTIAGMKAALQELHSKSDFARQADAKHRKWNKSPFADR